MKAKRKYKPNPRRDELKALSQVLKPLVKSGMHDSINEGVKVKSIHHSSLGYIRKVLEVSRTCHSQVES